MYEGFARMYVCVPCVCLVLVVASKGSLIPWNWSYK